MTMTKQELARQENLEETVAEIMARIPESWYGPARKKYRVRKKPEAWKPSDSLEVKRVAYCRPRTIWVL